VVRLLLGKQTKIAVRLLLFRVEENTRTRGIYKKGASEACGPAEGQEYNVSVMLDGETFNNTFDK
jgi:hypothetical protein